MPRGLHRRELVESSKFLKQLKSLGDIARSDEALCGLYTAISAHPEIFPVAHENWDDIRLARTRPVNSGASVTPKFSVWFKILDDDRIELLWTEVETTEE